MSSKAETAWYRRMVKHLPPSIYHMKNNNPYLGGIPDLWLSKHGGRDCWAEIKCLAKLPARNTTKIGIDLSPLQLQWITDRREEGRNVLVVVGVAGNGGVIMVDGEWEEEWDCARFKDSMMSVKQIAEWISSFAL